MSRATEEAKFDEEDEREWGLMVATGKTWEEQRALQDQRLAALIRRAQERDGILSDRDADAEAWIFISLGLLSTIDHRLGNIVGDDFDAIVASRREWMTGRTD